MLVVSRVCAMSLTIDAAQASVGAHTHDTVLPFVAEACVRHALFWQSVPRPASRAGAHMSFASARPAEQLPYSHRRAPEAEGGRRPLW